MSVSVEGEVRAIFQLYERGQFSDGLRRAVALHKAHPRLAVTNYCVGHGLVPMERVREALPFLRKATQIDPRNADYLIRYGRALLEIGRVREAEAALLRARDINPGLPIIPWTLAVFYASINRFDRAVEHFGEVVRSDLKDGFLNVAKADWANALIEAGQTEQGFAVLRELFEDPRTRTDALAKLLSLSPSPPGSTDFALLEDELARPGLSASDRASLLSAKAKCLAKTGNAAAEYKLLQESKSLRAARFREEEFGAHVETLISMFTPERLADLSMRCGSSSFRPIYVLGLPRSGTTLTEMILSSHSEVAGAGELKILGNVWHTGFVQRGTGDWPPEEFLREAVRDVEATMRYLCPGVERITDKMPHNFMRCGLIAAMFPNAHILHCYRNPADNFLSGFRADLKVSHSYFERPEWFAGYYLQYQRLMQHWYEVLPGRIYPVSYEKLVSAPREEIAALLRHCGLEWQDACLHPERNTSRIGTASVLQARSPINTQSVGGWKRLAGELKDISDRVGDGFDFRKLT